MISLNPTVKQPQSTSKAIESFDEIHAMLEIMIGEIRLHENAAYQVEEIQGMLQRSSKRKDLAEVIAQLTDVLAQSRYRYEAERKAMHEFACHAKELLVTVSHSLQAAESQAQSSFQGAQKTGNALERQVQDIAYRVRTSNKLDGMKVWLEQRLAIVDARLDDYQSQGVQQHTGLAGQLQKLGQSARELSDAAEGLVSDWIDGSRARLADHLTGAGSRQGFEERFAHALAERSSANSPQYILQIWDVDHLDEINKTHGRETGDLVLKLVADTLVEELGSLDDVFRYAGDEFIVLSNRFEANQLHRVADHLCETVENAALQVRHTPVRFTVSGGYTELRAHDTEHSIFQRVLGALEQARLAGGNYCWFSDDKR